MKARVAQLVELRIEDPRALVRSRPRAPRQATSP